jgi:hypothetical protein
MSGLRWFALAATAFLFLVVYALGAGVLWWALQPPEPTAPDAGLDPVPPLLYRALGLGLANGFAGGLLLAPLLALWVVRRTDESITNPAQQAVWWGRGNLVLMRMMLVIPLVAGVGGAALALQAGQAAFATGFVYGSLAGATGLALRALVGVLMPR